MREEVGFPSRAATCRGWLYRPADRADPVPAIVMAHGFSAVAEMHLPAFAEAFAGAGFAVLVFDFRYLGGSDGHPRGQIFPHEQHEDYRNAISWLAGQPGIDAGRIGIWGTSYSGGHVLHLSAFDPRIRAAVAQVPAISAWQQILDGGGRPVLDGLLGMVSADRVSRFETGAVTTIPVVAPAGQPCVLATPDSLEWFSRAAEELAPSWENRVTLESLERMIEYDPAHTIELVSPTPLLVVAAREDALIPIAAVRAAFERAGKPKRLLELDCGHFDVYAVEPWFSRAAGAAVDWFREHLA